MKNVCSFTSISTFVKSSDELQQDASPLPYCSSAQLPIRRKLLSRRLLNPIPQLQSSFFWKKINDFLDNEGVNITIAKDKIYNFYEEKKAKVQLIMEFVAISEPSRKFSLKPGNSRLLKKRQLSGLVVVTADNNQEK